MAQSVLEFVITAKDQASATFDKVSGEAEKSSGRFQKLGTAAKVGLGIAAVAVGKFALDSTGAASDLQETVSKSSVIFGEQAGVIEKWASTAATSMGLSKQAALESAASFGDMFTQIGFGGDQAAKMSTGLVQMAADLGSFNNLGTDEVLDKISGALRGEYDSLQALIPNINAARVEQEALAATGKASAKDLTAQEKATATLAIIQKDGARAAGDFARTSGGLANQQKILSASMTDLQAKVGTALLPALSSLVGVGSKVVSWVTNTNGVLPAFAVALGVVAVAWAAVTLAASPWLAIGVAIAAVIGGIIVAIKNWGTIVNWLKGIWAGVAGWFRSTIVDPVRRFFSGLGKDIGGFFAKAWAIVKATWSVVTGWFRNVASGAIRSFAGVVRGISGFFSNAWAGVKGIWSTVSGWFRGIVGGIGRAFGGVASAITAPFRAAFNGVRSFWNSTLGGKGFDVPGWVPGVGGKSFRIPRLATGGIVKATPGGTLAVLGEGGHDEAVVPLDGKHGMGGGMTRADLDYLADRIGQVVLAGARAVTSAGLDIDRRALERAAAAVGRTH